MTPDQIFDLASVTKVVGTTTAIAILFEENKLALDTPVSHYLPEFGGAPDHDRVTIRQLLTHSSGIPTPWLLYEKAFNKAGILKQVFQTPLDSLPGTKFVYRDPNFMLLGEVAERVSGKPIDEFLYARVFGPPGDEFHSAQSTAEAAQPDRSTQKMGRRVVQWPGARRKLLCDGRRLRQRRPVFNGRRPGDLCPNDSERRQLWR